MALTASLLLDIHNFEDNLEKAEVELQTFAKASKNMNRDLTRLFEDFSGEKVKVEAAKMARAIEEIGGASKLTEQEVARASTTIGNALAKYQALGQEAPESLQRLNRELQTLTTTQQQSQTASQQSATSFTTLVASWVSAQAVLGALTGAGRRVLDFLGDSIESYTAAEAASRKLATAIRLQGDFVPELAAQYGALASQFQKTTTFADDLITEMQALLVQVGDVMPSEMEGALDAATNLAAGLGIDLRTATLAIGKAIQGETGALQRYGLSIDEAAVAAEGATAVFAAVNAQFGGQAAAAIDTYAGRLAQAANVWDDFKESVGEFILTAPLVVLGLNQMSAALDQDTEAAIESSRSWTDFVGPINLARTAISETIGVLNQFAEAANTAAEAAKQLERFPRPQLAPALPNFKPTIDEIGQMDRATAALRARLQQGEEAARAMAKALATIGGKAALEGAEQVVAQLRALGGPAQVLPSQLAALAQQFRAGAEAATLLGKTDLAEQYALLAKTLSPVIQLQQRYNVTIGEYVTTNADYSDLLEEQLSLLEQQPDVLRIGALAVRDYIAAWDRLKGAVREVRPELASIADTMQRALGEELRDVLKDIPDLLAQAFAGGGDWEGAAKAIGAKVGGAIGRGIGSSIGGPLGGEVGAAAGSLLGPLFGKLLKSEGKEVNDMRDAFISAAGGLHALNVEAAAAGVTLTALLRADKVKEYQAAVDELTKAFDTQQADIDLAKAAMEEFGISFAEAGQAFKQAEMDEQATTLLDKIRALAKAGVDMDVVYQKVGDDVGAFIQQSIEAGTRIPREFQPIVEKMIEAGTLIDANGDKFTDLGQVPFADSLNDSLSSIADELRRLVDYILDVPQALNKIPRTIDIDINGHLNLPEIPDLPQMARGGIVRRPTLALVGEAGPEAIVPLSRGAVAASSAPMSVVINAQGAFLGDLASQLRFRRLISDTLMSEAELRTTLAPGGAY